MIGVVVLGLIVVVLGLIDWGVWGLVWVLSGVVVLSGVCLAVFGVLVIWWQLIFLFFSGSSLGGAASVSFC